MSHLNVNAPQVPDGGEVETPEAGSVPEIFTVPERCLKTNLRSGPKLLAEDVKDETLGPFIEKCIAEEKSEAASTELKPQKPKAQKPKSLKSQDSTDQKQPEMLLPTGRDRPGVPVVDLTGQMGYIAPEPKADIQAYLNMPATEIPVNAIWDFINSQDEVQKALAKRKKEIEQEHREHQKWMQRNRNKPKSKIPETQEESKMLESQTPERPESPTLEEYQLSAKAMLAMRLEREAELAELERLANLEVARQQRIAARKKDRQQQRERRAYELLMKKQNAFVKTLVDSTFPKNGGLFYSAQVSHGPPLSCLPVAYVEAQACGSEAEFWQSHLHLTCRLSSWALPNIAYLLSRPEFVAVQLCEEDVGPMLHVVLGCSEASASWAEISGVVVPGSIGQPISKCMRVVTSHHVFDAGALSIYASRGKGVPAGAPVRTATKPHAEACIGILKGAQSQPALLEILKSPKTAGLSLAGLRSVYLTDEQKAWAQPKFLADLSGPSDIPSVQSGPVIVLCVTDPEGKVLGDCVRDKWDTVFGPLDPALAKKLAPNTLRAKFGTTRDDNLIYVSRSSFKLEPNNVTAEISFFFAGRLRNNEKATAEDGSKRNMSALVQA